MGWRVPSGTVFHGDQEYAIISDFDSGGGSCSIKGSVVGKISPHKAGWI